MVVVDDQEEVAEVVAVGDPVLAGIDLAPLVGRHAAELFGAFGPRHGEASPELLTADPDLQHWRLAFGGDTGLVVDAIMAPVVDGDGFAVEVRIHLAATTPTAGPGSW